MSNIAWEPTVEEATAIIESTEPEMRGPELSTMTPQTQLLALMGTIAICRGLQALGYRIVQPLKAV